MARPTKNGLDFYPMDVGFLRNTKIRLLRAEFGASSVLFVLYVLGKAYEENGYFLAWDKDELLIAADELRKSPAYVAEVLQGCLSRSLFDERVFQMFGVLTSAGIQRRYLRGCEKRDEIPIIKEYWLLDNSSKKDVPASVLDRCAFFSINGRKNPVNSPGNSVNSPGNPQSKVKESKVDKSKVKKSSPPSPPDSARQDAPSQDAQQKRFEEFWKQYPKKVGKKAALSAWKKLKPDAALYEHILQAIERAKQSDQWRRDNGRFIPNPTTWLNQGRWDDELPQAPVAPANNMKGEITNGNYQTDNGQNDSESAGRFDKYGCPIL